LVTKDIAGAELFLNHQMSDQTRELKDYPEDQGWAFFSSARSFKIFMVS
jgi:hypothetical protein